MALTLRRLRCLISFLTIIPAGGHDAGCLAEAADLMFLFPLVGAFIGLLAGLVGWALLTVFDASIAGLLTLGFLLLITGLHHTDGLLDFGDGLMRVGTPEEKIRVMHDENTGAGGLGLGLITLLATAACISKLGRGDVVQSLIVCEASAKFAMVLMAWLGRSAHEGVNVYFIDAMHGRRRNLRLLSALSIALGLAVALMGARGLAALAAGAAAASIVVGVANRHFGGLTGDVFGAGNELARLSSLLTIVGAGGWR